MVLIIYTTTKLSRLWLKHCLLFCYIWTDASYRAKPFPEIWQFPKFLPVPAIFGAVVNTVTTQQEGLGFSSRVGKLLSMRSLYVVPRVCTGFLWGLAVTSTITNMYPRVNCCQSLRHHRAADHCSSKEDGLNAGSLLKYVVLKPHRL